MKKQIYFNLILGFVATIILYGGACFARPTTYTDRADIGRFTYLPADKGIVKQNEIQNTATGRTTYRNDQSIAVAARLATHESLITMGLRLQILDDSFFRISGEIVEFKTTENAHDGAQDWTYSIRYTITRKKDSTVLHTKVYTATLHLPPPKNAKERLARTTPLDARKRVHAGHQMPPYIPGSLLETTTWLFRNACYRFMEDKEVKKIFSK